MSDISTNESSSTAINLALEDITAGFNQNSKLQEYVKTNEVDLEAVVNNYSIFISYIDDTTVVYEFVYDDLCLNIFVDNNDENIELFNAVYKFLVEIVHERIGNNNIENKIDTFFVIM